MPVLILKHLRGTQASNCESRASWHLPLFIRPRWESAPLCVYLGILTGLSFIMSYAANLTRFSLITVIAMHAAFNTVSRFLAGLFATTQPSTALTLILVTRSRLPYDGDAW